MSKDLSSAPHVLLFPCPVQGHINPLLKLTELLCIAGLHVTFVTTNQMCARLLEHSDLRARFAPYPGFRIESVSDGLQPTDPIRTSSLENQIDLFRSLNSITRPLFQEMLASGTFTSGNRPPVTCIIADGFLDFVADIAQDFKIPLFAFHVLSVATIWSMLCFPDLLESGLIPFQGENDERIECLEGFDRVLRIKDMSEHDEMSPIYVAAILKSQEAVGTIFNSFQDLEGRFLSLIRTKCPTTYAVGPLHAHLNNRLYNRSNGQSLTSGSIYSEDRSCIPWLDTQHDRSTIYVSFGSLAILKKEEFLELWYGLAQSGKSFLWVMRSGLVEGDSSWGDQLPPELIEKAEGRGYIVGWAPQEEVLVHPAVGSFLTHGGWNSIIETIVAGLPMICWPYFAEQYLNSRCVSELYKFGVYLKDYPCHRDAISRAVNEVMNQRQGGLLASAKLMAERSKKAVNKGGSSYNDLNQLLDHIQSLSHQSTAK
ncbi:7-deoxyloganetic acid glucosyltransferase-like protein [Drosera capensis]